MSGSVSYELITSRLPSSVGFTTEGGMFGYYINDTDADSVLGTIVRTSLVVANGVSVAPAGNEMPIGIIGESGIAVGNLVKVIVSGKAYVLLEDTESSSLGYWCGVSTISQGRMQQTASVPDTTDHFREIGHSLQAVAGGTNVLSLVILHFN